MSEVFYVASYTGSADPAEVAALQAVANALGGSSTPPASNVFLISNLVAANPNPDLGAVGVIVEHLRTLSPTPTTINLVGHFGGTGLRLHRRTPAKEGDVLSDDKSTWKALAQASSVASAAADPILTPSTKIRPLGCSVLTAPTCDGLCDGPIMAHSIARALCCPVESVAQPIDATHFTRGALSTIGYQVLRSVGPQTPLDPKTCCPSAPGYRDFTMIYLPWFRPVVPFKIKEFLIQPPGKLPPVPLPPAALKDNDGVVGWSWGRPAPGLLAEPEGTLQLTVGKNGAGLAVGQAITLLIVDRGRAVFDPAKEVLYPLNPARAPEISALIDRAVAESRSRGARAAGRRR